MYTDNDKKVTLVTKHGNIQRNKYSNMKVVFYNVAYP